MRYEFWDSSALEVAVAQREKRKTNGHAIKYTR